MVIAHERSLVCVDIDIRNGPIVYDVLFFVPVLVFVLVPILVLIPMIVLVLILTLTQSYIASVSLMILLTIGNELGE